MSRLIICALLLFAPVSAWAQGAINVGTCGSYTPPAGTSIITMDSTGKLCTSGSGGGGGSVTQGTTPWVDNVSQFGGSAVVTGTGAGGAGIPRVTVSNDSSIIIGSGAVSVSGTATVAPLGRTKAQTSALASNLVVTNAANNLYNLQVTADSTLYAADWWIMVFDATSAPGDGAVTPALCLDMASGVRSYWGSFPNPIAFTTGITVVVSTTGCFTKTASTHAFIAGAY